MALQQGLRRLEIGEKGYRNNWEQEQYLRGCLDPTPSTFSLDVWKTVGLESVLQR